MTGAVELAGGAPAMRIAAAAEVVCVFASTWENGVRAADGDVFAIDGGAALA
jgi:hypothetical protein